MLYHNKIIINKRILLEELDKDKYIAFVLKEFFMLLVREDEVIRKTKQSNTTQQKTNKQEVQA